MTDIGINYSGINQDIVLGEKLGKYKTKEEALIKAESVKGSEIIYQNPDQSWTVQEVGEKNGSETDPLHKTDARDISLDSAKLAKAGISNPSFSLEFNYSDFNKYDQTDINEIEATCTKNNFLEMSVNQKVALARNPETDLEILGILANDSDIRVKTQVAKNPNTSPEILRELSTKGANKFISYKPDDSFSFPFFNGREKDLKEIGIKKQIQSENNGISEANNQLKAALAANPKTPPDVLDKLGKADAHCRVLVAANPSAPPDFLKGYSDAIVPYSGAKDYKLINIIASNKSTPPETLKKLVSVSGDKTQSNVSIALCEALIKNPSLTPDEIKVVRENYTDLMKQKKSELEKITEQQKSEIDKKISEFGKK
jgi:hypothetical protein